MGVRHKPEGRWKSWYWGFIAALFVFELIQAIRYSADPRAFGELIGRTLVFALVLYGVIWAIIRTVRR